MVTKYYIELPADEHGNTTMPRAVVEAELVEKYGCLLLIPVAPEAIVTRWPKGWSRNALGGWAEVDGPARMLSREEYAELLGSLPDEVRANTPSGMVKLRGGDSQPRMLVTSTLQALQRLIRENPIAFYELVATARDSGHQPFGKTRETLSGEGLLNQDGSMDDAVRSITLASTEGDLLELKVVNPMVTAN